MKSEMVTAAENIIVINIIMNRLRFLSIFIISFNVGTSTDGEIS